MSFWGVSSGLLSIARSKPNSRKRFLSLSRVLHQSQELHKHLYSANQALQAPFR
jgi:hypothetical protein